MRYFGVNGAARSIRTSFTRQNDVTAVAPASELPLQKIIDLPDWMAKAQRLLHAKIFDKQIKDKRRCILAKRNACFPSKSRWENHRQTLFARLFSDGFAFDA